MNIGIYSPNWIGDAVQALPFLNGCRARFPEATITVIAKGWVSAVYEGHPAIDRLVTIPAENLHGLRASTRAGHALRELELDRLYLLTDSLRSAYIGWLSGSNERIGYAGQGRSIFLTSSLKLNRGVEHRSKRYIALLGPDTADIPVSTGITLFSNETEWAKKQMQSFGYTQPIAILPGSIAPARKIPLDRWASFLEPFVGENPMIVIGGPSDQAIGDQIVAQFPDASITSVCGEYDLRKSLALLSQCTGALATDSGLGHAAASLGLPTVSVFGSENPAYTAPLGDRTSIVSQSVHCSPCRKNICHNTDEPQLCLYAIEADALKGAYDAL